MSSGASGEETSVLLTSGGKTSALSVLLLVRSDPVDLGVSSDSLVVGVNKDDFEELEGSVLADPVGVEDSEVSASSSDSLFSDSSVRSVGLKLVDTLVDGFTVDNTLGDWLLSATSSDSDSVNDVTLLSLVTELSGLIGSGRSGTFVDDWELSVFPCSHSEDESQNVRLLLSPKFFKILVSSHLLSKKMII